MAFNIVCVSRDTAFEQKFAAQLDGLAYDLVVVDADHFRANDLSALEAHRPRCIMHFLPADGFVDTGYIADAKRLNTYACDNNIHFIQLSSFLVFGDQPHQRTLTENDATSHSTPQSKLFSELEKTIIDNKKALAVRTSWLLNSSENGVFSCLVSRLLEADKSLAVSDHNFGNPIHSRFLIDSLIAIVRQQLCGARNVGVYHLCSADTASEAELADHLMRMLNNSYQQKFTLPPVAGAGDDRTAMPVNARLDATRITHSFGIQLPTWRKGFKTIFNAWLEENYSQSEKLTQLHKSAVEESK